ncbi:MFS general substrate transporter [Lactarius hengduanensis]|nr:MFS general substrate transporter [Lactarius hengduanensis]
MPTSLSSEKVHSPNKEDSVDVASIPGDENASIHPIDPKVLRRATLKIDFYLIPIISTFFFLSFLDRSNIGNARVAGLTTSLHMSAKEFSIALTITFVPYLLMELPMNLVMKRLGANVTLPVMVILWGVVCACQGAVHSYRGLLVCRFFLGALEGGLTPGITLLFSNFYKRHALQLRCALMFSVASLTGAFSGLLAYGIRNLDGKHGIAGWQWIFIVEGGFTVAFGLATLFFVPASPKSIKLLTKVERETYFGAKSQACSRMRPMSLCLLSPRFSPGATVYGLAYFTPTIVNALGHSPNRTQLLTVPPYACSFVFSIVSAYFSDKYKCRGLTSTVCALIAAIGYAMFLVTAWGPASYRGMRTTVQPHYRRATAIAITSALGIAGAIVSPWLFSDAPRFKRTTGINLAFSLAAAASSVGMVVYFRVRNAEKRREVQRLLQTYGDGTGAGGWDSPAERKRLGDRHPRFEFTM